MALCDKIIVQSSTNQILNIKSIKVKNPNKTTFIQATVESTSGEINAQKTGHACDEANSGDPVSLPYNNAAGKVEQLMMVMTKSAYVTWTTKMGQSSKTNIKFNIKTAATETDKAVYYEDYKSIVGINPFADGSNKEQAFTVQGATICSTEHGSRLLQKTGVTPIEDDFGKTGIASIQWINNWGVICDPDWDDPDAAVFCNSIMGYGGIPIFGMAKTISSRESVWLTNVTCAGSEPSLYTCGHTGWDIVDGGDGCDRKNYAGVQCFKNGYQDLKLIGDYDWVHHTIWKGVLAIKYDNHWGSICAATKWTR